MRIGRKPILIILSGLLVMFGAPRYSFSAGDGPEAIWQRSGMMTVDERPPIEGRVSIEAPYIANPGDSLTVRVSIDSPTTADDYVDSAHIYVSGDPWKRVASFYFGRQGCRPSAATRITMQKSGYVIAIARMHDGSLYIARHLVKIAANPYVR